MRFSSGVKAMPLLLGEEDERTENMEQLEADEVMDADDDNRSLSIPFIADRADEDDDSAVPLTMDIRSSSISASRCCCRVLVSPMLICVELKSNLALLMILNRLTAV